jgi:hypothetical protein
MMIILTITIKQGVMNQVIAMLCLVEDCDYKLSKRYYVMDHQDREITFIQYTGKTSRIKIPKK